MILHLTTANFQKYYNNYFAEVRVYGGLPTYHVDYASKPIQEVGTLRVIPNIDNDIIASFSGLLKSDVNVTNQLSEGIDINHFTAFYVEYREGYDENDGANIETNYTAWVNDEIDDCGGNSITNGNFVINLNDWSQVDYTTTGASFVWVAGTANATLSNDSETQVIYQEVNMVANAEYDLLVDIGRSSVFDFRVVGSNDLILFDTLSNSLGNANESISQTIVPSSSYKYLGFVFFRDSTVPAGNLIIDNVSFTSSVCDYLFWGSNSSLQFQNVRGGNMYDYINGRSDSKFMTNFEIPTLFTGNYFDLSMILKPANVSGLDVSDSALMWLVASDINQADSTIVSSWTDRTGNATVTGAVGFEPDYKTTGLNGLPTVNFASGEHFTTDLDLTQGFIVYSVVNDLGGSINPIIGSSTFSDSSLYVDGLADTLTVNFAITGGLIGDTDLVIKTVFNGVDSFVTINDVDYVSGDIGTAGITNMSIGDFAAPFAFVGNISELIIMPIDTDDCEQWRIKTYLGNKYGTYSSNDVGYVQNEYDSSGALINTYLEDVNYTDTGVI